MLGILSLIRLLFGKVHGILMNLASAPVLRNWRGIGSYVNLHGILSLAGTLSEILHGILRGQASMRQSDKANAP